MGLHLLVVGSGFSGAVLSHTLANKLDCSIGVWDERDHIAGNCFTQRDEQTQVNYCDQDILCTRITEHRHFAPWEENNRTVYFKEYSKDCGSGDVPYYPKRLKDDIALLKLYRQEAEKNTQVSFLGRLATYRYLDMHYLIKEALDFATHFIAATNSNTPPPVFLNRESYE